MTNIPKSKWFNLKIAGCILVAVIGAIFALKLAFLSLDSNAEQQDIQRERWQRKTMERVER